MIVSVSAGKEHCNRAGGLGFWSARSAAALTLLGGAIVAGSSATLGRAMLIPVEILGSGILALVLGLAMLLTGASDE